MSNETREMIVQHSPDGVSIDFTVDNVAVISVNLLERSVRFGSTSYAVTADTLLELTSLLVAFWRGEYLKYPVIKGKTATIGIQRMCSLRKVIEELNLPVVIYTYPGYGYKLELKG